MEHSQPTSIWLHRQNTNARVLTDSLCRIYLDSGLMKRLAWRQFWKIFRANCKWCIKARRGSDYCDHCALFKQSILPGISKSVSSARTKVLSGHLARLLFRV